jgi:hypothetical protein
MTNELVCSWSTAPIHIDIAVRREDLPAIAKAVQTVGLEYRHVAGIDMLVQTGQPKDLEEAGLLTAEIEAGLPQSSAKG